jgi:hypothetical protein
MIHLTGARINEDIQEKNRPIIFIGHSMGGILILQVLIFDSCSFIHILTLGTQALIKSKSGTQYLYHSTFTSTRQLFLFGVPHQGMEVENILLMIKKEGRESSTRWDLVRQLSREGSNFLNHHHESIVDLWPPSSTIRIVSFYERLPSPTVEKVRKDESNW